MADTVLVGGVNYSTDDITTLNGATVTAGTNQTQRFKAQYGDDGTARDVSLAFPLPTMLPDVVATGTITATDAVVPAPNGTGTLNTGTPTAGSFVAMALPGGDSAWTVQLTGTFGGGTVWFECSASSTNGTDGSWSTLSLRTIGTNTTVIGDGSTLAGLFRGNASGMTWVRVRITGATTPSVAVVLRASDAVGPVALNAPLPAGANAIGTVSVQGISATPSSTNFAAAATGTAGPLNVTTAGNVTFTVKNTTAATAFTGNPVIVFEQSDDNTSWSPLQVIRNDTTHVNTTHTIPAGTANGEIMFDGPAEAISFVRARVTTGPSLNSMTVSISSGGMPFSPYVTATTSVIAPQVVGTGSGQTFQARAAATTAATAVLQAAPSAGLSLYVTDVSVSNAGATLCTVSFLPTAGASVLDIVAAATGGGGSMDLRTPIKLAAATGLSFTTSAASTTVFVTVVGYIAP